MAECCDPRAYRREFDEKNAQRLVRDYRRHGLGGSAQVLVDFLRSLGVEGMTVLEVGGGIGQVQIELLEAGAVASVNVELSDGYERAARELLAERGLTGRVERRLGDFVTLTDVLEPADIVVLNRVVCCYPWMSTMVDAAVGKARRFLALSFPRDHLPNRAWLGVENLFHRIRRSGFRAYVHTVAEIERHATGAGLTPVRSGGGLMWKEMVFQRA